MPKPRKAIVALEATPYYHCTSRCVRRAFLCGEDAITGHSYEHRRQWIEDRLLALADIFAIDICAYAVMSNHYHVVLHVDTRSGKAWSPYEVIERWHRLFQGNLLSQRFLRGDPLSGAEQVMLDGFIDLWRYRLMDISWYMRILNEGIARKANKEESCTGRFWEGRFKSQALLDEQALIACMAYVDLNPVRARMATAPEASDHTAVQSRVKKAQTTYQPNHPNQQVKTLMPFVGYPRKGMPVGLPFRLSDYLDLIDWTGRIIRDDKRGAIPSNLPSILDRLNLDAREWRYMTTQFESRFKTLVGSGHRVRKACEYLGQHWAHGIKACEAAFPN